MGLHRQDGSGCVALAVGVRVCAGVCGRARACSMLAGANRCPPSNPASNPCTADPPTLTDPKTRDRHTIKHLHQKRTPDQRGTPPEPPTAVQPPWVRLGDRPGPPGEVGEANGARAQGRGRGGRGALPMPTLPAPSSGVAAFLASKKNGSGRSGVGTKGGEGWCRVRRSDRCPAVPHTRTHTSPHERTHPHSSRLKGRLQKGPQCSQLSETAFDRLVPLVHAPPPDPVPALHSPRSSPALPATAFSSSSTACSRGSSTTAR